ncbi:hypothetical protein [Bosea thiooxidans]
MRRFVMAALIGLGVAASLTSAHANETLPKDISQRLDRQPVQFTMTAAKRERLMIIQENMARQRHYGRGYGYGGYGGYGYGHHHRYGGPPPWAPAYGYRRGDYDRRW